jgi:hypothetical protein
MDSAGPSGHGDGAQAVKLDVAKVALFDLETGDVPAIAVCGEPVELARTTVGTVAVGELRRLHFPFDRDRHATLPISVINLLITRFGPGRNCHLGRFKRSECFLRGKRPIVCGDAEGLKSSLKALAAIGLCLGGVWSDGARPRDKAGEQPYRQQHLLRLLILHDSRCPGRRETGAEPGSDQGSRGTPPMDDRSLRLAGNWNRAERSFQAPAPPERPSVATVVRIHIA